MSKLRNNYIRYVFVIVIADELREFTMYTMTDTPDPRSSSSKRELGSHFLPIPNDPNGKNIDFRTPRIGR